MLASHKRLVLLYCIFSILVLEIPSIELYPFQFLIDDRQAMFPVSWTFRGNCRLINFLNFFILYCLWEPRRWRTGREKGCGQWHEQRTIHTTVIESVCCPVCVQWIRSDNWNIWKKNHLNRAKGQRVSTCYLEKSKTLFNKCCLKLSICKATCQQSKCNWSTVTECLPLLKERTLKTWMHFWQFSELATE